ncbi:recombinase RecA [Mycoplasma phocimorsus]|uniref:recombinase RecA n=1 Tax=Mycoplasma phocimorsus TaxID=3045839 RepID=UPI0024BFC878|nr:recombinase RecA [Mycoplasma phocimorsus]MDJ1646400.1 recombinase RecA [Mycoplasma phocimorsus]MDJ1647979.1 recombinase RecA [Mycoplasma phocimorsus]MDJ1648750.1 recombinase RecA [Mycoplasma phocimorsus]
MEQKNKLKELIKEIEKKYGKETLLMLGEKPSLEVETFSTGSLLLNNALGINGWPKGRIIEIFGPESSGKTTMSLHAIAEVQKRGGTAVFIDVEHSIDPNYAKNLGVDIDKLLLSQPDSGEKALEIVDILARSGHIDLIVIDSVAALVPEVELNGEMKDQTIGSQARLMSKALRKITATLSKNNTSIIFINQVREKIGVIFGNPETTPGGRALKFYASIRVEVRKLSQITENKETLGNGIKMKVVKNKLAPPFKTVESEIIYSKGINIIGEIIQLAIEKGVIERKGTWYSYNNENIAQGISNLTTLLKENEDLYNEILKQLN